MTGKFLLVQNTTEKIRSATHLPTSATQRPAAGFAPKAHMARPKLPDSGILPSQAPSRPTTSQQLPLLITFTATVVGLVLSGSSPSLPVAKPIQPFDASHHKRANISRPAHALFVKVGGRLGRQRSIHITFSLPSSHLNPRPLRLDNPCPVGGEGLLLYSATLMRPRLGRCRLLM